MNRIFPFTLFLCIFHSFFVQAQVNDSTTSTNRPLKTEMRYNVGNGKVLVYPTPKKFGFVTNLPKDAAGIVSTTFSKQSIKPLLLIGASTTLLLFTDQTLIDGVRDFSDRIHLSPDEKNHNVMVKLGGKDVQCVVVAPPSVLRRHSLLRLSHYLAIKAEMG